MKQYTMTIKFQVEDSENSEELAKLWNSIRSEKCKEMLSFDDITTTEVRLEEDENNPNETNS